MRVAPGELSQDGLSLVELMVVVVIIGILAAVAMSSLKSDPVPASTRVVSAFLNEARRHAVAGGPVRADVTAATGITARVDVEFENTATASIVRLWKFAEDPSPATSANWVLINEIGLNGDVRAWALGTTAESASGQPLPPTFADGTAVRLSYFANGTAEAYTVYLGRREDSTRGARFRVFVFPLSAIANVGEGW